VSDMSSWTLEQRRAYEAQRETVSGMDRAELANEARAQEAAASVRLEFVQDQVNGWVRAGESVPEELAQVLKLRLGEHDDAVALHRRLSADLP
jgi:hypothetical protein